jgi:LysR family transcriptional regulator, cyn operon transcriptional activator
MNLQQLRYLVSVADAGSVTAAARVQRVSQPVMSRALRDLERELDVALFERSGRRLALTEAGQAVVESARHALDAVQDVVYTARQAASGSELAVAATPTNSTLLSPIITSFAKQWPESTVRLCRANDMDEVVHMVSTREAELGFGEMANGTDVAPLRHEPLWNARIVVVSPVGTDLPVPVPLAILASSPLVLPPTGSERRKLIDDLLTSTTGRSPAPVFETDERSAWISCAQRGIGSYLSYEAATASLDDVTCRPLDPPLEIAVGFVYRPDASSREGMALRRLARECTVPVGCRPADALSY